MSRKMTKEELAKHCHNAVKGLGNALAKMADDASEAMQKRAMLISYWLRTYTQYITREDEFDPKSVYRLKRGNVVQVEFGYRVGRELGGRHYAMVLDQDNTIHRNTVTVIPLGSIKKYDSEENKYRICLEDGMFSILNEKINKLIAEGNSMLREAELMNETIKEAEPAEALRLKATQRERTETAQELLLKGKEWAEEISDMKSGSVAMVDQITTISKMRITQPLKKTSMLYGIRLSERDMDMIDEGIKNLYFRK